MLNRLSRAFRAWAAPTLAALTGFGCAQSAPQTPALTQTWKDSSMHTITVKTLEGADTSLSQYAGKVTLVVNVASQCGLTGQYAGLQRVYDKYRDRGLVVLGFPSGDFGSQEFNDANEIRDFCTAKYSVTFPLFEKCGVVAGPTQSKVFECLGTKTGELPGWNFGKYVVSRDGRTAKFFTSTTDPEGSALAQAIEAALAQ